MISSKSKYKIKVFDYDVSGPPNSKVGEVVIEKKINSICSASDVFDINYLFDILV